MSGSASSAPRAPASHWSGVLLIVGAGIASAFQVGKAPVALEAVRAELALDLVTASWLLSAFAVVGALGGIAAGVVVDRAGARALAIAGLVLQGLGSAAGALAPAAPWLMATRIVEGMGFLAVMVAAPVLIERIGMPPRQAPRAFAAWSMCMPLGMCLVMLGAPLLQATGWRDFWLLNAALLLGYAGLLARATRGNGQARPSGRPRPTLAGDVAETLGAAGPRALGASFAAFSALYFAVFGFLPSVLAQRWPLGPSMAGALTAVAVATSAIGNLAGGALLARGYGASRLLPAAFALMAACSFGIFGPATPAMAAYALCVVFSCIGGVIPAVLIGLAPGQAPRPELVGTTMGWLMQGNNVGLTLGPLAAGAVAARWGWPAVPWLLAAVAAGGAAMALTLAARNVDGQRYPLKTPV